MKRILIVIMCLLLTSCYDYKELDDIHIVSSIYIDYDDEYIVYLETVKSSKEGLDKEILTGKGIYLSDAINDIKNKASKELFLEHVEILVLSNKLATKGIKDTINYIIRDLSINNNYYVVISDDINNLLQNKSDSYLGEVILELVNNVMGENDYFTIDIVARDLINGKKDIVLPYLEDKAIEKIAYFNNDKMVGNVDKDMYLLVMLNSNKVNICKDGNVINIYNVDKKYKVSKDLVIIELLLEGKILEINDINLGDEDTYKYLNQLFIDEINNKVNSYYHSIKEDILGIRGLYNEYFGHKWKVNYRFDIKLNINKNGALMEERNDS